MAKAVPYFTRVAQYQKAHPRASREHAMKMVSKEISGTKKKTVGAIKKPRKKSVTKTERITTIGTNKRRAASPTTKAISIAKKIEDLEIVLKNTPGTTAKNHLKRLINLEHDKLDAITTKLKSA